MKKKLVLFIGALMLVLGLVGCDDYGNETQDKESTYTQDIKEQSLDTVGLPDVTNFFEMSQLKEIYELRDNPKLICYWYTTNEMTGKLIYRGTCIGYGIPYSTQVTNPNQVIDCYEGDVTIDQAEPNGLYSTGASTATWVLTSDKDGNISPTYVEDEVTVSQVKVEAYLCEDWSIPSGY